MVGMKEYFWNMHAEVAIYGPKRQNNDNKKETEADKEANHQTVCRETNVRIFDQ